MDWCAAAKRDRPYFPPDHNLVDGIVISIYGAIWLKRLTPACELFIARRLQSITIIYLSLYLIVVAAVAKSIEDKEMPETQVGWLLAIVVGAVAGWLAEIVMKSNQGLLMNIVMGVAGALLANLLLSMLGVALGGVVGYLIAGFVGACLLIAIGRMFRKRVV